MPAEILASSLSGSRSVGDTLGAVQTVLEYAGTVAFGISGALAAGRRGMDFVGVIVLGVIVAVGGGTARDLLLGIPVFWVKDPTFVVVGAAAAVLTVPLFKVGAVQVLQRFNLVQLFDAAGMACFVVISTDIALFVGADRLSAVIIGVVAGVGGGVLRDVLADRVPSVLRDGRLYATAAFAGAVLLVGLRELDISAKAAVWLPILLIFGIRAVSLYLGVGVPKFSIEDE